MRNARNFFIVLAILFTLVAIATQTLFTRTAVDSSDRERYASDAAWTIQGIRPGDLLSAHQARLGIPAQTREQDSVKLLKWNSPTELFLEVSGGGEILSVSGQSIEVNNNTLISQGSTAAQITEVFGEGKVVISTAGKGFVIDLQRVETGRTITYNNQGVKFVFNIDKNSLTRVRASK